MSEHVSASCCSQLLQGQGPLHHLLLVSEPQPPHTSSSPLEETYCLLWLASPTPQSASWIHLRARLPGPAALRTWGTSPGLLFYKISFRDLWAHSAVPWRSVCVLFFFFFLPQSTKSSEFNFICGLEHFILFLSFEVSGFNFTETNMYRLFYISLKTSLFTSLN